MDQLKVILAHLKKQHFWVLATLVLILSLTGWYVASAQLVDQYTTNKNKIESEFNELRQIVSQTNHPNEKFEAGTNALIASLTKDVRTAWESVYEDQKAKVLKWPEGLGKDFLEWIEAAAPNDEIPIDYRDRYLNYVKEEFPRLLQIVDARPFWERDDEEAGGGRGNVRPRLDEMPSRRKRTVATRKDYKVLWESKNQEEIDQSLDFREGVPSSTAVRYCQENLWVYHALLDAIALVNEGATGNHNAKIKEIVSLNIGKSASVMAAEAMASGHIVSATNPGGEGGPGMPGMPMGMEPGMGDAAMPGPPTGHGMSMAPEGMGEAGGPQATLDDKRYVDEKGMPLPADTPGPAEFKRMPIVMQLVMDQREIARLLVALADSPLPVEIRQVRINTKMAGVKREPHRQFGFGMEGSDTRGSRRSMAAAPSGQGLEENLQYPYDLAVEISGFIYIFNPPDKSLSTTAGEDGVPVEGDATTQPPAEPAAAEPDAAAPGEPAPDAAKPAADAEAQDADTADAPAGDAKPDTPAEPEAAPEEKLAPEAPPAGFDAGTEPAEEPTPEKPQASPDEAPSEQ